LYNIYLIYILFKFYSFREPWKKEEILDRSIRAFKATIGPAGGTRGYQAITGKI
jgi:hypothetical protein